jgi:hypothetical protein
MGNELLQNCLVGSLVSFLSVNEVSKDTVGPKALSILECIYES